MVRVVEAKGASIEFCGGTHISNTSKIGLFKILSETSVAAGTRRIEAVTGTGILELIEEYKDTVAKSAQALKLANYSELPAKCAAAAAEIKTLEKEKAELNSKLAASALDGIMDKAADVNGVKVVKLSVKNTAPDVLRSMGDKIKDMDSSVVAVLAADNGASAQMLCVCGKDAVSKGAHAGKIVQKITALTGGKGGGRPDSAMAGVGDTAKIAEALAAAEGIVSEFIK